MVRGSVPFHLQQERLGNGTGLREGRDSGRQAGGNRASLPNLLSQVALQTVVPEPHPVRGQLLESPISVPVLSVLEA